jgi:DNA-binding transcriptional LysR family regulator
MRLVLRRFRQLQRLAVFEAVGRLGTFTAAAQELGTSQPAVSKQMAALEHSLSTVLFDRHTNRRTLTPQGRLLHGALSESFDTLEVALSRLRADSAQLRVAVQPSVAESWFAPRLRELREAMAPARVSLTIFDHDRELAGIDHDISIRFGDGRSSRQHCERLVRETVVPVASPDLATELGLSPDTPPGELLNAPLLHVDQTDRSWQHWATWFAANGKEYVAPTDALLYPTYGSAVPLAIGGNGVILSWRTLSGDLLSRGLLRKVGPALTSDHSGYFLHWPSTLSSDDGFLRFRSWLHATIAALS